MGEALTAVVIYAAIALVASAISVAASFALAPSPRQPRQQQARFRESEQTLSTRRDPAAPRSMVYGRFRKGGVHIETSRP